MVTSVHVPCEMIISGLKYQILHNLWWMPWRRGCRLQEVAASHSAGLSCARLIPPSYSERAYNIYLQMYLDLIPHHHLFVSERSLSTLAGMAVFQKNETSQSCLCSGLSRVVWVFLVLVCLLVWVFVWL